MATYTVIIETNIKSSNGFTWQTVTKNMQPVYIELIEEKEQIREVCGSYTVQSGSV